ncbi:MAG: MarR family transcriptional regulator/GNAT family N-acetyltransferase [Acidobacteria bacterium]|nr:MarR family transcriptional regulator/GNAT family N-acetyltransferase [Acidobacteriota bacterium]
MKKEVDFLTDLGLLAFVTRLKRVSDRMLHDGRRLYKQLGMDIEPNWYVIFKLLEHQGPFTVTEIADRLGFAHPSVISIVNKMIVAGYLEETRVTTDSRKRHLKLTPKAVDGMPAFEKVWKAGSAGIKRMLADIDALEFLNLLETRVAERDFRERAVDEMRLDAEVEISCFRPEFASDFARLNYEWISEYFEIEEKDRQILDDPQTAIIDSGGAIFFASVGGRIVGTVALIATDADSFELAKMAVASDYRGLRSAID